RFRRGYRRAAHASGRAGFRAEGQERRRPRADLAIRWPSPGAPPRTIAQADYPACRTLSNRACRALLTAENIVHKVNYLMREVACGELWPECRKVGSGSA